MALYLQPFGAGVAQLVTTLQTSLPVRVRIPAIPKRPWLRGRGPSPRARWFQWKICRGPLDEQNIPQRWRSCGAAWDAVPEFVSVQKSAGQPKKKYNGTDPLSHITEYVGP